MKVKVLLFLVFVSFLSLTISSYREGPAYYAGYDCTGATGSRNSCSGGGCHGTTTSNNVTIELDSAGVAVTSYYPGHQYTVKLSGTNGTGSNLPYYGFQMASVLLSGAGTSTPTQGGTWDSTALAANVQYTIAGSCQVCSGWPIPIVENSNKIAATSGTGGNGTTYVATALWTAPPTGTGSVNFYGIINAVNGNNNNDNTDKSQTATPITVTEAVISHNGINSISSYLNGFSVYPTLMNENVTVAFDLKQSSDIKIEILSMQGAVVKTILPQQSIAAGSFRQSYDVNELSAGVYLVRLQAAGSSIVSKVVKE